MPPLDFISSLVVNNEPAFIANTTYDQQVRVDKILTSCILSTISLVVLATMDDFATSYILWDYLMNRFSSLSRSHIHQLKTKLHCVSKTGTIGQYLAIIKDLSNKFAATGGPTSNSNLIFLYT